MILVTLLYAIEHLPDNVERSLGSAAVGSAEHIEAE
jgi:hypothetical protein